MQFAGKSLGVRRRVAELTPHTIEPAPANPSNSHSTATTNIKLGPPDATDLPLSTTPAFYPLPPLPRTPRWGPGESCHPNRVSASDRPPSRVHKFKGRTRGRRGPGKAVTIASPPQTRKKVMPRRPAKRVSRQQLDDGPPDATASSSAADVPVGEAGPIPAPGASGTSAGT